MTDFDDEMRRALMEDAEKLGHLTGEDHTPQFLFDRETCAGEGYIAETIHVYEPRCGFSHPDCETCGGEGYITIHVYEPGCGFSHPDVYERPCQACGGNGWFVGEAGGDR